MKCILCQAPADKQSIFFPGVKTKLILGNTPDGVSRSVLFGICTDHLDAEGNYLEGMEEQIKQAILRRIREPGVPDVEVNLEDLADPNNDIQG